MIGSEKKTLEEINSTIEIARKIRDEVAIVVVANVKSNNPGDEYKTHSLKTEFYSENEYEEIITAFRENGYYVIFHKNETDFFLWFLNNGIKSINKKFIAVYNAASGGKGPGRKALIPAFCNLNKIAITSSNPYVVSLCRHKYHFNSLLQDHNLSVAPSWYYSKEYGWLLNRKPEYGTKVIAKPTYESASIGVDSFSVFEYAENSDIKLYELSKTFDQPITIQQFISGYEIEVPVIIKKGVPITIEPIGLGMGEIKLLNDNILTYDIVYNDNYTFYPFIELGEDLNNQLLSTAKKTAMIIGIEGFGRVDFRITTDKKYYIIDVSTYPHIIHHSSFWYMFNMYDFKYCNLFGLMVGLTAIRYNWV
jgi:D-alanine-D-alanine ligase